MRRGGAGARRSSEGGPACIVCGATGHRTLHRFPGRRVLRCRACGLVFVDPMPGPQEVAELERRAFLGELREETRRMYAAYGRGFPEDPVVVGFRRHLSRLRSLAPGPRLLDVGVGSGLLLALAREQGWEPQGVDICAEAAERAAREFGVRVSVGRFEEASLAGPFAALTLADVLEHSPDPRRFLRRAHELLQPGGVLYIGVPNHRSLVFLSLDVCAWLPLGERVAERLYVPNHLYYFSPASLARLLIQTGFELVAVEQEDPYLGRYALSPAVRYPLRAVLALGRATGLRARLAVFARRPPVGPRG